MSVSVVSGLCVCLTLYQPMMHICVMSSHKNLYGGLILGVNTLYRLICFFKLFPMVGKGLSHMCDNCPLRAVELHKVYLN